jgi:predicted MFS family arabinose efflux permease
VRTPALTAIRRLAIARFISVVGSLAAYTALIDLVFRRTNGSPVALSITVLLTIGATGIFSPFGGLLADRWDRKRAMIASDLAGAALFAVMAFIGPIETIVGVALLTAIASTPFRAGSTAAVPNLVEDPALVAKANSWLGIGANLGIVFGPAIGGVLTASIGAGSVFLLNTVSFVVSAALVWSIRAPFSDAAEQARERGTAALLAGFRFIRHERVFVFAVLAWMVLHLGGGMDLVADRPIAEVFHTGSVGYGAILGLYGVGAVAGAWIAARLTAASELPAVVAGFVVAGVLGIGIALAPIFAIVLACNVVWGVADGVTTVARQGILQRRTPDALRSRVAAASDTAFQASLVVPFLAAGPVIATIGAQATYAVGAVAFFAAAALATIAASYARRVPAPPEAEAMSSEATPATTEPPVVPPLEPMPRVE